MSDVNTVISGYITQAKAVSLSKQTTSLENLVQNIADHYIANYDTLTDANKDAALTALNTLKTKTTNRSTDLSEATNILIERKFILEEVKRVNTNYAERIAS